MGAKCTAGDPAPDKGSVGKIYRVNPTGNLDKGTVVELTYFADQVAMPHADDPDAVRRDRRAQRHAHRVVERLPLPLGHRLGERLLADGDQRAVLERAVDHGLRRQHPQHHDHRRRRADGQTVIVTYTVDCSGGSGGEQRTSRLR